MRFTDAFGVQRGRQDKWYNIHLSVDTRVFLDPLLLLLSRERAWAGAHDELIAHFVHCYQLIGQSTGPASVSAKAAERLLTFPEPQEFCLGFTAHGTRGSGSGARYARTMMDGIACAMAAGLNNPQHIEEIGILNAGIGADRISDAVCNVLKHRFIAYTQRIAARHNLALQSHTVRHARCLLEQGRWLDEEVQLPTNPATGGPIILVPQAFLNDLPTLNAREWFDSNLNDDVRLQMNLAVGQRVRKEDIVRFARQHPDRVRQWAQQQTTRRDVRGYDFGKDRLGVVKWDGATDDFARTHPIQQAAPTNRDELRSLVEKVLQQFKRFVEEQHGWSLLWNDDGSEKPEEAAQLLFLGLAQNYLRLFDVEVDREVELGRGPVDFKIARGTRCKIIIEVKKAHNGRFWNGLENQLPSYLVSDDAPEGWFMALRYRSGRASEARMRELPTRVAAAAVSTGKDLRYLTMDGRRPVSASRL